MLGAILGDFVGARFEMKPHKSVEFDFFHQKNAFTDDSILTIATAEALLTDKDFVQAYKKWARLYPRAGFGGSFKRWMKSKEEKPYNSWGNGSAMRVSPVAWVTESLEECLDLASQSASVTHNHTEGIKGAQATAAAIFLAKNKASTAEIAEYISTTFQYDLQRTVDEIRPNYKFDVSCQGSVPESIICALEASSCEEAIRLAISLGGDADTMAAIAASIAEARFGGIAKEHLVHLKANFTNDIASVVEAFQNKYIPIYKG